MKKIIELCEKIKLPKDVCDKVLPVIEQMQLSYSKEIDEMVEDYRNRELTEALANKMDIDIDLMNLAGALIKAERTHDEYRKRGISDEIYFNSMRQIRIWTLTHIKNYSKIGLGNWGWVNAFFEFSVISIGRLDFAPQEVVPGVLKINVHIPEDGPLNHDKVMEAYKLAYNYFNCKGLQLYACDSWLLFPGNYEFLSDTSNIKIFMDDYHIIHQSKTKNSGDLWRVFGKIGDYSPENLPRDTKLRRGLAEYLEKHDGEYGEGSGVFLFDGERIY